MWSAEDWLRRSQQKSGSTPETHKATLSFEADHAELGTDRSTSRSPVTHEHGSPGLPYTLTVHLSLPCLACERLVYVDRISGLLCPLVFDGLNLAHRREGGSEVWKPFPLTRTGGQDLCCPLSPLVMDKLPPGSPPPRPSLIVRSRPCFPSAPRLEAQKLNNFLHYFLRSLPHTEMVNINLPKK